MAPLNAVVLGLVGAAGHGLCRQAWPRARPAPPPAPPRPLLTLPPCHPRSLDCQVRDLSDLLDDEDAAEAEAEAQAGIPGYCADRSARGSWVSDPGDGCTLRSATCGGTATCCGTATAGGAWEALGWTSLGHDLPPLAPPRRYFKAAAGGEEVCNTLEARAREAGGRP